VNFLLDTNVVSEWTRPRPDTGVIAWLADADEDRIFISVVTLAELRHGVERLAAGQRKRRLDGWLTGELVDRFEERILDIDPAVADEWGRLVARREMTGEPMHAMDALIAATAAVHDLALVTRNTSDFERTVRSIVNPWAGSTRTP
jgi:toxin FitB